MSFWYICEAKIKFHSRILRDKCAIFGRNGISVCLFGKMEINLCPAVKTVLIGFSAVLHAALGQANFQFLRNFARWYYMKGHAKNSKGAQPKSRKFKGEKRRNESIKARSTPFRSPPIIPQCFSKNHSKTRESKIFLIDFFDSSQKWQTKKTPNTRRCWGLTIIYLCLSFLISCCALHHSNISALICQYFTVNCNFYKCTFKNHDLK